MNAPLMIVLIGLIYVIGFGSLSFLRRQGLSLRFAVEGLILTALGAALTLAGVPVHPLLFLVILYLLTMRVRLLVELGNLQAARRRYGQALNTFQLALRLGPDGVSRQIVQINRGVTLLRMQEPEAARVTLEEVVAGNEVPAGALYMAAAFYNLGLACLRTGREAEAVRRFNQAIDTLPSSIYAHASRLELKKRQTGSREKGDGPQAPGPDAPTP